VDGRVGGDGSGNFDAVGDGVGGEVLRFGDAVEDAVERRRRLHRASQFPELRRGRRHSGWDGVIVFVIIV